MSYRKQNYSKRTERIKKCVECGKRFFAEPEDETNTCPPCVEHLMGPCHPEMKEVG